MKSSKNIMITCGGGGGPIFLARHLQERHRIFLVDGSRENAAPYLGFPFERVSFGNNPVFIKEMQSLINKWHIDCIVPGADEELIPVSKLLETNHGLMALIPSKEFIELCLDKRGLMEILAKAKISTLLSYESLAKVKYPALAKPNSGRGSRQVHKVKNKQELDGYLKLYSKKFQNVLVQPYIEGVEYTVSVIVNNKNKFIGIVPKRVIEKRGITRAAVSERNIQIEKVCKKIIATFNPRGPFNVQLKLDKGKIYIFEINPRLSTTSVLSDKAFGNEVMLHIKYHDKDTITHPPKFKEGVYLYRYEENIFK
ncbi:MAG: ATP-grasp domain-containing protein [Patescibacteria group bacterium]